MTATIRHKLATKQNVADYVPQLYKIEKGKCWNKCSYKKNPCSPWQHNRKVKSI